MDINAPSYHNYSLVEKNKFWEETKRIFNFEDDEVGLRRKRFDTVCGEKFRLRKTRLRTKYLHSSESKKKAKKSDEELARPWEVEGFGQKDWETFVANYKYEDFQKKSRKARESVHKNIPPHTMRQITYERWSKRWALEGRIPTLTPPTESIGSTVSPTTLTSLSNPYTMAETEGSMWACGHEKYLFDGTYDPDLKRQKTIEMFKKLRKNLELEVKANEEGIYVPIRGKDVLTEELSKTDHPGWVIGIRGVGSVLHEVTFDKSE